MKTTMTLSANINCPFWELFDRDADDVILLINFYIGLEPNENAREPYSNKKPDKDVRIRVNDKTATGGWF
ncbi:MAG: hypothetical protein J6S67_25540 [Methanobrevibacter sp.]|nr:hypothetical protein [Methanobrevibacter sp.]